MFKQLLAILTAAITSITTLGQPPAWYGKTLALPTPTPIEIHLATPTPTITPPTKPYQQPKTNQVDCTGPDGKHFKASQQECDNFNKAWGHGQTQVTLPSYQQQVVPNLPNEVTIPCLTVIGSNIAFGDSVSAANQNCSDLQARAIHDKAQIDSMGQQAPIQYTAPQPVDNTAARESCRGNVLRNAQIHIENIIGTNGQNSFTDALVAQAQAQENSDLATCNQQYP